MNLRSISPALALAAVALGLTLAGCAASPPPPTVASLPGSAGSSTTPPAGEAGEAGEADALGVQFRLDDTPERREQIVAAWDDCLLVHGAQLQTGPLPGVAGDPDVHAFVQPIPAQARAACVSLMPLMPPELSPATNPDFHAQSLQYVDCMAARGLFVRLLGTENTDWTYVDGKPVPDNSGQIEHDCLLEAFGS